MDRALEYESRGRTFESYRGCQTVADWCNESTSLFDSDGIGLIPISAARKNTMDYITLFEPKNFLVWFVDEHGFVHVELTE